MTADEKRRAELEAEEHAAEVDAMVARMERGRAQWRDVRWPGGKMMVRMRTLATGELQEAEAASYERFRDLKLELNGLTLDTLAAEKVTQILWRACMDPNRPVEGRAERWRPMYRTAAIMRDATKPDERALMWAEYEDLRIVVDPSPDTELDQETLADIDEALKKRSLPLLACIGSWRLASYLLITESRRSTSPMPRSSSSSDSESSSET